MGRRPRKIIMADYFYIYNDLVHQIAAEFQRRYIMCEKEDIEQELWLWFASHSLKLDEWSELEQKDQDKLIAKSIRNAALKYCEKEKAKTSGYELADLYYYDISVVEAFLPSIITESYELPAKIKDLNHKPGKGDVSDGMNWLTLRSDIASAFYKLTEAKQKILIVRFADEQAEWNKLAKEWNTTPDGARMKVQRAMSSLVQNLGGWRPRNDEEETTRKADTKEDSTDTE